MSFVLPTLVAAGCTDVALDPGDDADLDVSAASSAIKGEPVRVLAGDGLTVLAVTGDDHVIVWDGTSIYASGLFKNAPRHKIADSGPMDSNLVPIPTVQVAGNIAFIWPDASFGSGAVSRLFVWTAASGGNLASTASISTANAAAASPNGRDIIYTTNVSGASPEGDIVTARPNLRGETTLVAGVDFACAQQMPFQVGFDRKPPPLFDAEGRATNGESCDGDRPEANPVVGYCPIGSSTAVLARWVGGVRHDLASDVRGFPQWSVTHDGSQIFTIVGTPVVNQRGVRIDRHDQLQQLEDITTRGGSINLDDTIVTFNKPGTAHFEMHRFTGEPPSPTVVADMGPSFNLAFNTVPTLAVDYSVGFGSTTGVMSFGNRLADGNFNWFLADTLHATRVSLQQDQFCIPSGEPFTADSQHAVMYCFDGVGAFTLSSASLSGAITQISTGDAQDANNFGLDRGIVTYNDDHAVDANGVATSAIKIVDLNAATPDPRVVASEAFPHYLPTADRRRIVFSSHAGLFVQRVR